MSKGYQLTNNNGSITINAAYTLPAVDGTINQQLTTNGAGAVAWSSTGTGTVLGTGTTPRVAFWTASNTIGDNVSFQFLVNQGIFLEDSTANHNVFVGTAGNNTATGNTNTAVGYRTGLGITTGDNNVFYGSSTGQAVTSGLRNSFFGQNAGTGVTTSNDNTLIGQDAGSTLTTGARNTLLGTTTRTGANNTNDSVAIGYGSSAQNNQFVAGSDTSPLSNIFFGNGAQAPASTGGTSIVINGSSAGGVTNNITGGSLTIAPGRSTGTATPANVLLEVTHKEASSTTLQSLSVAAQTQGFADYMAFKVNKGYIQEVTVLNDADFDASTTANLQAATPIYFFPTLTAGRAFTLPLITNVSWGTTITVTDGKGSATVDNITITASGGDLINGAGTFVMNQNYQSTTLVAWGDIGGNYWSII